MIGNILRKTGMGILMVLKGFLQVFLFLFKLALNALKLFLLLFSLVARIVLAFVGIAARN